MTNLVKNGANGKFWEIPAKTSGGGRLIYQLLPIGPGFCEIFHVLLEKNVIQFVYILGQIATVSIKCEYEFISCNFL